MPWMWPLAGKESCRHALPEEAGACIAAAPEWPAFAGQGTATEGLAVACIQMARLLKPVPVELRILLSGCPTAGTDIGAICVRDCITSEMPCPWTLQTGQDA